MKRIAGFRLFNPGFHGAGSNPEIAAMKRLAESQSRHTSEAEAPKKPVKKVTLKPKASNVSTRKKK